MGLGNHGLTLAVVIGFLVGGCAPGFSLGEGLRSRGGVLGLGRGEVIRPAPESLVLGKTTLYHILQRFGVEKVRERTETWNGQTVRVNGYAQRGGEAALVEGIVPHREMKYYFVDGVLVGYVFDSSYRADHTDFDEAQVTKIKKGETRETQVIELLGKPGGRTIWPVLERAKGRDDSEIVYSYVQYFGRRYSKLLVVSFDANGIVKEVFYDSQGQR